MRESARCEMREGTLMRDARECLDARCAKGRDPRCERVPRGEMREKCGSAVLGRCIPYESLSARPAPSRFYPAFLSRILHSLASRVLHFPASRILHSLASRILHLLGYRIPHSLASRICSDPASRIALQSPGSPIPSAPIGILCSAVFCAGVRPSAVATRSLIPSMIS